MSASPAAPGFDQPLAMLKYCHDKIRRHLTLLQQLHSDLIQQAVTLEMQQTASALLQYFETAAPLHHADEECDLMPMLQSTAQGADAALLLTLVPQILADHHSMDLAWSALAAQLSALASGAASALNGAEVAAFSECYLAHMIKEEMQLAPMAKRIFSTAQMSQLGQAMQSRRAALPQDKALAGLRTDYLQASLDEADVLDDPITQFGRWFDDALTARVLEANAMTLATVGADGKPSARIVLIKQFDHMGFTWYTNYASEKGQQLAANPQAALLFFWRELERQVRIEGRVVKVSAADSDQYFYSRPLPSQLSALASQQSAPVASRAALDAQYEAVASAGSAPQRPANWGGYRLLPERIEFWQGRSSRLHDRLVFTLQADGTWERTRLQP